METDGHSIGLRKSFRKVRYDYPKGTALINAKKLAQFLIF